MYSQYSHWSEGFRETVRERWVALSASGVGRVEFALAATALVVALVSSVYLAGSVVSAGEACYGVAAHNNPCSPLNLDVVRNLVVVLGMMLVLYAAAALCALGQARAKDPSARFVAFMFLLMLTFLLAGTTFSATDGPGRYYVPSTILLIGALIAGIVSLVRDRRSAHTG
jgi:hypothetical protein